MSTKVSLRNVQFSFFFIQKVKLKKVKFTNKNRKKKRKENNKKGKTKKKWYARILYTGIVTSLRFFFLNA